MTPGKLFIVGVGPGDPELLTLKAVRVLRESPHVFVPVSRLTKETWLRDVVACHGGAECCVHEVSFSVAADRQARTDHWQQTASGIVDLLRGGHDVAFVTLGDPQLYSTSLYLIRALRKQFPGVLLEIVPGVSSVSHAAALTRFALGEGHLPVTILPSVTALDNVRSALKAGGTLVLMKIGKHLQAIIDLLDDYKLLDDAVFIARAGLPGQHVETDLRQLRGAAAETGNLAVILIHTEGVS